MAVIRTVLGDVDSDRAGVTLAHEHILYAYPGADLDHRTQFDFEQVAGQIAGVLRAGLDDNSVATVVEMTPVEVYRHPPLMRAVSERSGVHIIAVTGFFPQSMGIPYYWRRQTVEELTQFFVTDLTEGMIFQAQQTRIRAGAIKIATGGEGVATTPSPVGVHGRRITNIEDRIIRAAAHAQQAVGGRGQQVACRVRDQEHPEPVERQPETGPDGWPGDADHPVRQAEHDEGRDRRDSQALRARGAQQASGRRELEDALRVADQEPADRIVAQAELG